MLDELANEQWFTTLYLLSGYFQILMDEDVKEKSNFISRFGMYQFKVLPFGVINAPSTFQLFMGEVFKDFPFV